MLGQLGRIVWCRCRDCGIDHPLDGSGWGRVGDAFEYDYVDYVLDGLEAQ